MTKTYSNPRMEATIENWPSGQVEAVGLPVVTLGRRMAAATQQLCGLLGQGTNQGYCRMMINAGVNFHWVKRIEAETNTDGVLKITLWGGEEVLMDQFNKAEILIFLTDHAAVERLVKAINEAMPTPGGAHPYRFFSYGKKAG